MLCYNAFAVKTGKGAARMMRRIAAILALLTALSGVALASGCYVIDTDDVAALVDADGAILLDGVDRAFTVREGSLYAAGSTGDYALYDATGMRLGDERFSMIDDAGDALIFFKDGLYGAMDDAGAVVLPAVWDQLVSNGAGGFLALSADMGDGALYISSGGDVSPTGVAVSGLTPFHDGRMPYVAEDGRYGCLDAAGGVAVPARFSWIGEYVDGMALAAKDGKYGMIDLDGAWRVEAKYGWMGRGDGIVAALLPGEAVDVYDVQGSLLYTIRADATQAAAVGDCAAIWEADAARLYNSRGRGVYEASPRALFFPGAGGQVILSEGRWGAAGQRLIDPSGIAGEGRYQRLLPLCADRYAYMTMQGVEYYSADLDSLQISWDYGSVRWGLIDGAGVELLPAEYREIRALGDDRLLLVTEDAVIFADLNGGTIRAWPAAPTKTNS